MVRVGKEGGVATIYVALQFRWNEDTIDPSSSVTICPIVPSISGIKWGRVSPRCGFISFGVWRGLRSGIGLCGGRETPCPCFQRHILQPT